MSDYETSLNSLREELNDMIPYVNFVLKCPHEAGLRWSPAYHLQRGNLGILLSLAQEIVHKAAIAIADLDAETRHNED